MVIDLSTFGLLSLQLSYDEFKNRFTQSEKFKSKSNNLTQEETKQSKKVFTK